jgi:hypothetical protein
LASQAKVVHRSAWREGGLTSQEAIPA